MNDPNAPKPPFQNYTLLLQEGEKGGENPLPLPETAEVTGAPKVGS